MYLKNDKMKEISRSELVIFETKYDYIIFVCTVCILLKMVREVVCTWQLQSANTCGEWLPLVLSCWSGPTISGVLPSCLFIYHLDQPIKMPRRSVVQSSTCLSIFSWLLYLLLLRCFYLTDIPSQWMSTWIFIFICKIIQRRSPYPGSAPQWEWLLNYM